MPLVLVQTPLQLLTGYLEFDVNLPAPTVTNLQALTRRQQRKASIIMTRCCGALFHPIRRERMLDLKILSRLKHNYRPSGKYQLVQESLQTQISVPLAIQTPTEII